MRCLKSQSFISLDSSSYSDLVDLRITTNFHTNIYISHMYNHYDVFITTNRTVNRHWYSDTNAYLRAQSLYCIYKSFRGKIIHAENDWIFCYCYQIYNNRRFYRRRPAMTDGQRTANNCRRLFGVYSYDCLTIVWRYLYAHTTPNWVKLLAIYERDIGQSAASHISPPSSPLSAMNACKSSALRL